MKCYDEFTSRNNCKSCFQFSFYTLIAKLSLGSLNKYYSRLFITSIIIHVNNSYAFFTKHGNRKMSFDRQNRFILYCIFPF